MLTRLYSLIFSLFLGTVTFLYNAPCYAQSSVPLTLYTNTGIQNHAHYQKINEKSLTTGQEILLSNGKTYIFLKEGGRGRTNIILQVVDKETGKILALRIPLYDPSPNTHPNIRASLLIYYMAGYEQLKDYNLRMPTVYEYKKGEYILQEWVDGISFSFEDILLDPKSIPEATRELALKKLYEYTKNSLSTFTQIMDLYPQQLVFIESTLEWRLLDTGPMVSTQNESPEEKEKAIDGFLEKIKEAKNNELKVKSTIPGLLSRIRLNLINSYDIGRAMYKAPKTCSNLF